MPAFPETPFFIPTPHAHLSAVLHRAPRSKSLVILCHGFTGNKAEHFRLFIQTARALQKAGINALRFDFKGSGDSSGDFHEMTPNTQILDALDVLAWGRKRYKKVAFLGFSFGGATSICASQQASPKLKPDALLTWCAVPSFKFWEVKPPAPIVPGNPLAPGKRFYTDRPKVDVPEAYLTLTMPRLQIQGTRDIPGFREKFSEYAPKNDPGFRHLIIPDADHCFTSWPHRRKAVAETVKWFRKQIG